MPQPSLLIEPQDNLSDIFRQILDLIGIDFALYDEALSLVYHSSRLADLLDFQEPLIGTSLFDTAVEFVGLEDDVSQLRQEHNKTLEIAKTMRVGSDGQPIYLTLTLSSVANNGYLLIVTEVTYQVNIEQGLRQKRNELQLSTHELVRSYNHIQSLMRRFLPKSVVDMAIANPKSVRQGGEKRTITVLFADIRGFTSFSEMRNPEQVMTFLNRHFDVIGQIIEEYGGVINSYAGDMIVALFNAPESQSDHVYQAVKAGLAIQKQLETLNDTSLRFGIGINTGTAVVGYLGFRNQLDYTAIGETMNVGARLSATAHGGEVLVGPETFLQLRGRIKTKLVGPLKLKGKLIPVTVYTALAE